MTPLLTILFLGYAGPELLEIPTFLTRPEVRWADLNEDGVLDIWLNDRDEHLWVWDGTWERHQFQEVSFEPVGFDVQPLFREGQWLACTYDQGRLFEYTGKQGWLLVRDYEELVPIRSGMRPIPFEEMLLAPTHDGYRLLDDVCERHGFKALPSIEIEGGKLKLTYPIPRPRDMNGDGILDLFSAPVAFPQHGELRLWTAIRADESWTAQWARLQFPDQLEMRAFQTGDLNGDSFEDLVVLAMPDKDISVFEELTFIIYLGTDHGQWNPVATQILKTKQNLWQTGPIEVNAGGVFLFYYKGIFRSHFKIDRYAWHPDGYIEPKPISEKWTMDDARREFIDLDFDMNGDGLRDLMLYDEKGLHLYPGTRRGDLPFNPDQTQLFADDRVDRAAEKVEVDGDKGFRIGRRIRKDRARGDGSLALVRRGDKPELWNFFQGTNGFWYLRKLR